jgi:hypothetical protein
MYDFRTKFEASMKVSTRPPIVADQANKRRKRPRGEYMMIYVEVERASWRVTSASEVAQDQIYADFERIGSKIFCRGGLYILSRE